MPPFKLAPGNRQPTKHRLISSCGNEVAHTSVLCPTCHADLAPEPRRGWFR